MHRIFFSLSHLSPALPSRIASSFPSRIFLLLFLLALHLLFPLASFSCTSLSHLSPALPSRIFLLLFPLASHLLSLYDLSPALPSRIVIFFSSRIFLLHFPLTSFSCSSLSHLSPALPSRIFLLLFPLMNSPFLSSTIFIVFLAATIIAVKKKDQDQRVV
ncbi:unnamed protein product [Acanthosepion pharaonis]|uniref:Transmembrane protein n=1 Tax=Acanthosepion pharaonis TaxID=158019 RepID=A0A812EDZ0_ACAPH|nr:unnamed protein product [Sepia pharaonis]